MRKLIIGLTVLIVGCQEQPQQQRFERSVNVNVDHGRVDVKIKRKYNGPNQ